MDSVRIVAETIVRPEFLEAARSLFQSLAKGSQAEAGNISYIVTEDVKKPGHFFIIEEWQSPEAIAGHNKMPHFLDFQKKIAPAVEKRSVTTLRRVC